ncbi:hypothetical protein WA026_003611 [Henosepilachna vigintioctopunctata]|uniref:Uncharacterized protein n=1 Tax=Henosepilachna vigintioctopunctata TaxID=420089 RepID=A0AAW1THQ8_9CUCU
MSTRNYLSQISVENKVFVQPISVNYQHKVKRRRTDICQTRNEYLLGIEVILKLKFNVIKLDEAIHNNSSLYRISTDFDYHLQVCDPSMTPHGINLISNLTFGDFVI